MNNTYYENIMEDPRITARLKMAPRIIRHFNFSRIEERAYICAFIRSDMSDGEKAKINYIRSMYAQAHAIQIGHLRIYFSGDMPIGIFHPDIGALCVDNMWERRTAYHLNRVNKDNDKRLSLEVFHALLNEFLIKEVKKPIKLYVPVINDFKFRQKLRSEEYIAESVW